MSPKLNINGSFSFEKRWIHKNTIQKFLNFKKLMKYPKD